MSMAATTMQTAHESVSAFINVRLQLERYLYLKQNNANSGDSAGTLGFYKIWNITNEVSNTFNDLHPQLRNYLNVKRSSILPPRHYRGPREPRSALRCYMVGLTQDRASPHVAILCKERWFCTQARQIILNSRLLQDRGWVGCIRLPYEIRQNGATSPVPQSAVGSPPFQESTSSKRNLHNVAISHHPESTSGLRIAIPGLNGYVRMATLGGIIEINGELFGLSVSHAFSAQTPNYDGSSSEHEADTESFVFDQDDLDPFVRNVDSVEISDIVQQYPDNPGASETSNKPTQATAADETTFSPDTGNDIVDPFISRPLDIETAKWSLGSRATFGNEAAYEYEWALISMDDDNGLTDNGIMANLATTSSGEKLAITSVASKMAPAGTRLLLNAPRGGITAIAISSESSVQLTSSKWFLGLWTVRLDRPEDGDCGSWIVDHGTGKLFGMLVATCEAVCEAYILPIKDIFTEIKMLSYHSGKLPSLDRVTEKRELKPPPLRESKSTKDSISTSRRDSDSLYSPLLADNIRIVCLLSGPPITQVQCKLVVHNFCDPLDYEGLCYISGRSERKSCINVNGQLIWVNSSLASALEDLRYTDRPRFLWVDALCINPGDIEERNSQVSLLAPIMRQAHSVCIWLGKGDDESHRTFSSYYDSISEIGTLDDLTHKFVARRLATDLADLFGSALFHHGFVQAICLARDTTVYCGRDSISWRDFVHLFYTGLDYSNSRNVQDLTSNWARFHTFIDRTDNLIQRLDDGQIKRKDSLVSLVIKFDWLETTIVHDTIYSMLSLARDVYPVTKPSVASSAKTFVDESLPLEAFRQLGITPTVIKAADAFRKPLKGRRTGLSSLEAFRQLGITPTALKAADAFRKPLKRRRTLIVDYSQLFEHVCKDFVQLAIEDSQSLDILCQPWAPQYDKLPSWVPELSQAPRVLDRDNTYKRVNGDCFVMYDISPGKHQIYNASRLKTPSFQMSNSLLGAPNISVKGFSLDAIQKKQSPALMGNIPPGWLDFLGWKDMNQPPPEEAWRTLVGDRALDTHNFPPAFYPGACQRLFQQIVPGYGLNISQLVADDDDLIREFLQRMAVVVWGRRLIRTEKHDFVGLAPGATKKRDIVAILYGLSVPVVLRRIEDSPEGDNVFKIVGECFVYDMMDGQALEFKEAQGIQDQTFMLQ